MLTVLIWIAGSLIWAFTLYMCVLALATVFSLWCCMPKRVPTFRSGPSKQAVTRMYERARPRQADKNFYSSKPWLDTRRLKLSGDPLCADCLKAGRYVPATDVHHILERKDRPDLALDHDNLECLCKACHGAKRRKTSA